MAHEEAVPLLTGPLPLMLPLLLLPLLVLPPLLLLATVVLLLLLLPLSSRPLAIISNPVVVATGFSLLEMEHPLLLPFAAATAATAAAAAASPAVAAPLMVGAAASKDCGAVPRE